MPDVRRAFFVSYVLQLPAVLLLVGKLLGGGNDRLSIAVEKHGETSAVSAVNVQIVHTGALVHPYFRRSHTLGIGLDKSLFLCHF